MVNVRLITYFISFKKMKGKMWDISWFDNSNLAVYAMLINSSSLVHMFIKKNLKFKSCE